MSIQEKIKAIEKEIRETPYHKGTQRHIGNLRGRLAKLRKASGVLGGKGGGLGYAIPKTGDATVVLVGPPSVGKSTLINALTNVQSPVAEYEFTTLKVIPGMLLYKGAHIQILDVPGLLCGAARGRGRGRQVLSIAKIADLILLMTDVRRVGELRKMEEELMEVGIYPEDVPILKVINKIDMRAQQAAPLQGAINGSTTDGVILISAKRGDNIEKLREEIWRRLRLIRVFMKSKVQERGKPLIMQEGATVREAAEKISSELAQEIEGARIWGKGAVFQGQQVSLDHTLIDKTTVKFM